MQCAAGRLHAASGRRPQCDQRDALRQAQFRFHPRHRAGRRASSACPMSWWCNPSVPAKTVPEFIAYAKANPGKINMASAGIGTRAHLAGELFKMMAGVNMVHVPYRGERPALPTCSAGRCRSMFATVPASIELHQGRQAARAGGDRARRARTRCRTCRPWANSCRATRRARGSASARPRTRRRDHRQAQQGDQRGPRRSQDQGAARRLGRHVLADGSPADFGKLIADETEKWGKVIRVADIKPE